jgi:3D (Asp-Asp-Asp) domain-containing protein
MYNAKKSQTDSTPHITADGTRINVNWAGKYRYIAVSRDLLEINGGYLNYGDYIVVQGINGKYDGIWQVKDTMNKRWNNRVDLLCNPNERPFKKNNVIIKYYL